VQMTVAGGGGGGSLLKHVHGEQPFLMGMSSKNWVKTEMACKPMGGF